MSALRSGPSSFRARLLVGYVLVAAVFTAAWLWSLYGPLTRAVVENQARNLTAVARTGALLASETSATPSQLARRVVGSSDLRMTIVAADGTVIADSLADPAGMENHANRPEIAQALAGQVGRARRTSATRGDEELYVAVPGRLEGEAVAVRVSQPLAIAAGVARTSQQVGVALLLLAIVGAGMIAWWSSRAAAVPVQELSGAARRMADGDLRTAVPDVPGDLHELSDSLAELRRQMRARIDELEAEQATLRTALDGLADAVFLVEGGELRYANGAAGELFRIPPSGWRGRRLEQAGLPASLVGEVVRLVETAGGTAELGPDPTGRWLRVSVVPLEREGGRTLVVISDVSERADLDRMRRDFVANASHELKTPVAGIQLLARSARDASEDGDVDQALAFSDQISDQSMRLQRLVSDLLDLSRLETAPEPGSVVDVRQAIDRAITGHRAAAERKGLALSADLSAVEHEDVYAATDPTDAAIALDNLLDNAITYTESGSVTLRVDTGIDEVQIAITDTGIGIPAEHLPRIFERFYRVDAARSRESGGTGLGLSLVRHVVERSGGSVEVRSVPGEGSSFVLRMPRAS